MAKEKVKKPFYKKWWVWLLAIIVVIAIAGMSDEDGDDKEENSIETSGEKDTKKEKKKDKKKDEKKVYKIGDTVEFKNTKFTLKEVTTTDERNQFADIDPTAVIKIEYELENTGDEDLPFGTDITVYDADGNKMESYPNENSLGSVASGKKVQGEEHHAVESLGKIEIHYAPMISLEKSAVFEVEIE